ncbi:MAG: hypothetical protein K2N67_06905 [Mucispirillum sp.]|nr:hypothetical protein [Mucispirillum sp.]
MKFKSGFPNLKVLHGKGFAVFVNGEFETDDKAVIKELKRDKMLYITQSLKDTALNYNDKSSV